MQLKWIFFTCIFDFSLILTGGAQETKNNFTAFDWSFSFFKSEPSDLDHIRGGVASFYAENSNKGLACISFRGTTSVKFEQFRLNDRIGLGTGIRFSQFVQNTGKWDMITEGANYFYFLYRQDDQNTYYAKLKSIAQTSSYLGLPVEFTFFPLESPHFCRLYIKMGAEIDFRLGTHTTIHFKNEGLESLEHLVRVQVSSPSAIGFSIYNGIGIRMGTVGQPSFSVELLMPVFNTNPGSPGLLKNRFGAGVQFSFHVPIKSENQ